MEGTKGGKQYGLQLRVKAPPKKPARPVPAFSFDDGAEEDTVEDAIARQATKKRSVREVELQHKRALEEDPSAFDYDGVYDEMKGNQARPIQEDRAKRESKYIGKLLEKAKLRTQEHDVVYERQLAKERAKEDHLYGEKEKFVTGAYKKKLMEQAKWLEEERLRELREQKEEVTNKQDLSDFYRNLLKNNVAFGTRPESKPSEVPLAHGRKEAHAEAPSSHSDKGPVASSSNSADGEEEHDVPKSSEISRFSSKEGVSEHLHQVSEHKQFGNESQHSNPQLQGLQEYHGEKILPATSPTPPAAAHDMASQEDVKVGTAPVERSTELRIDQPNAADSVAAAKERYLARKRQRNV
ncbi:unnamed protein product [Sphagnum jensenii]|uniref:Nuclear speckle splicing regulatory protein 1 N-terminal domain-containing protein n=1 Tax=Sphagnum jensenii TaxID=128206 RepID=A0ABP0WN98_9BRYO